MSFLTVETTEFVFCPSRCGSEETEENSSDGETFTVCLPLISNSKLHYEESTNEDTCRLTGISDSFNQCTCPRQDSSDYYCDSLESEDCFQGGLDSLERICTIGAGTFGRVVLSRHRISQRFFALKILPIRSVIESQQVDHVHWEKRILERIDHPFIVKLHWALIESVYLFMVLDYLPGGELFSYLRSYGHFPTDTARFYTAEIVLALEYLHRELNVAYRDLKPENLMLDGEGHLKITDFGFSKVIKSGDRSYSCCGTPDYLAPELVNNTSGHDKGVDWWALGVFIFEMLAGVTPFFAPTVTETCELIVQGRLAPFPDHFSGCSKDLITKLLTVDLARRLGCRKKGIEDIKEHRWFAKISWLDLQRRLIEPPIKPAIKNEGDTGNFDEFDETSLEMGSDLSETELKLFENW